MSSNSRIAVIQSHMRQSFQPQPLPENDQVITDITVGMQQLEATGDLAALISIAQMFMGAAERVIFHPKSKQ